MVMLPRFIVFAGDWNAHTGGWHNFKGEFHTLEEANAFVATLQGGDGELPKAEWWHVVDLCKREVADGGIL